MEQKCLRERQSSNSQKPPQKKLVIYDGIYQSTHNVCQMILRKTVVYKTPLGIYNYWTKEGSLTTHK